MKKFIAMIIIAITLGACSKSAGDNYIGNWKMDDSDTLGKMPSVAVLSITKSGSIYVVKDINNKEASGPSAFALVCSGGATLKDDTKLYCRPDFAFSYDETTHKLLTPLGITLSKVN
ncbi:MAG: hypothetical protein KA049_01890 [Burkholderiales bacterium]|nr:hypothetical protein [Burkholderiales bacterium]MBP9769031.1 hypothetical protein [Burkholderiales bacterium]